MNKTQIKRFILIAACSFILLSCSKSKDSNQPVTPHEGKLLYKTDFSPTQFSLGTPVIQFDNMGAWQHWTAINAETGVLGPVLPYGAYVSILQYICNTVVTVSDISNHIENSVQRMPGPAGDSVYALFQNAKENIFAEGTATQDAFVIIRDQPITEVQDFYYSCWFMFQPDLVSKLGNNNGYDNWRYMSSFKTGGSTDYRAATVVTKDVNSQQLYWVSTGEGWDSEGLHHDYWNVTNNTVTVPVGQWFFYEVGWHRGTNGEGDGRYWVAVNGQPVVDFKGSLYPFPKITYPKKIDRIFLNDVYSGGNSPMQQWVTDLEIWDGWPCGEGVSCYTGTNK
jgi:hypothetical protein